MIKAFVLSTALSLAAGMSCAATVTLLDDDFSAENYDMTVRPRPGRPDLLYRNNAELLNFAVIQGSVDVINKCKGTGFCVDLDGSTPGSAPTIISSRDAFTITEGNTYEIGFLFQNGSKRGMDPFTVSLGNFISQSYAGYSFPLAQTLSFVATASGIANLNFGLDTLANDNRGPRLTHVWLTETTPTPVGSASITPAAVPLPAGLPLLLGGLGLMGLLRRRKS